MASIGGVLCHEADLIGSSAVYRPNEISSVGKTQEEPKIQKITHCIKGNLVEYIQLDVCKQTT
jgi:hypothetical protein